MPFRNDAVNATIIGTDAATIADGADVAEGSTTDAAITSNAAGTISGKLRGLVTILADVWDSVNHRLLAHVGGTVAAGVADSGNPVKVGAKYNATLPTLTDGWRTDLGSDSRGNLNINIRGKDAATGANVQNPGDGMVVSNPALNVNAMLDTYNGTSMDRVRNDGTTGGVAVGGSVASAATDSGNPVKIGGKYNATKPTLTDGQRGDIQIGTRGSLSVQIYTPDGASNIGAGNPADGASNASAALQVDTRPSAYAPTGTTAVWDRARTVTTFKTATATASGDTAVWTPTSGKKFRLLRYAIYITGQATLAGAASLEVLLRDATTATGLGWSLYVPAIAITDQFGWFSGWITVDNGVLSAAANNVLNVNLSAALTAGEIRVVAVGTEE